MTLLSGEQRRIRTARSVTEPEIGPMFAESGSAPATSNASLVRCNNLLALAAAKTQGGDEAAAEAALREAAELAEYLGDGGLLSEVVLALPTRHWPAPGEPNPLALLLAQRCLAMSNDDPMRRAMVTARLGAELSYFASRREYARKLSEVANQLVGANDSRAKLYVGLFLDPLLRDPECRSERLANAEEVIRMAAAYGEYAAYFLGAAAKSASLCISGAIACAYNVVSVAAATLPMRPSLVHESISNACQISRAVMDGRFSDAENGFRRLLQLCEETRSQCSKYSYWPAMLIPLGEAGRLAEIESLAEETASRRPSAPIYAALLSWVKMKLGKPVQARLLFERLAPDEFGTLTLSEGGWVGLALLAEVCNALDRIDHAAPLYQRLLPYRGLNTTLNGFAMFGSTELYLGQLALTLGRVEEGIRHFEDALESNLRMGAVPWAVYSRRGLASALMRRGGAGDRARAQELFVQVRAEAGALGMKSLCAAIQQADAELAGRSPARDSKHGLDAAAQATPRIALFHREGNYWRIGFEGREFLLRHLTGMPLITFLLERAGEDFPAPELARVNGEDHPAGTGGHGSNTILDAEAKRSYRERMRELALELEEATSHNDLGRAEKLQQEQDFLNRELAGSVGLLGRERGFNSQFERARKRVSMAIGRAIAAVASHDDALGQYLERSIRTGHVCSYTPSARDPIHWRF